MCIVIVMKNKYGHDEPSSSESESEEPIDDGDKGDVMDMTIYPIKEDPTKPVYREVGDPLLKPPFTYAFVGFRGSSNDYPNEFDITPLPFLWGKR